MRFRDRLHLILGFSAGAVIAVAFFDLLPESLNIGTNYYSQTFIVSMVAVGFFVYMLLDRFISLHQCQHVECGNPQHSITKGRIGAGTLSIHSLLDGMAIGFAFQVSAAVGAIVAIAVLAHDFSDGINTVSLVMKNGGKRKQAFRWLMVDAVAPFIGVLLTLFIKMPESILAITLAIFCGFFLYIGTSDFLPESHHSHPTKLTTFMTILGVLVIYMVIRLASL